MRGSGVRNVVFDIGGVLLQWDPRLLYRDLIPSEAELEWFLSEVCTAEWNATLDAGRPFDTACDELAGRYPAHAELVQAWRRQDAMIAGEVTGMDALVKRLRAAGVGLYLLTNMPANVFNDRRQHFDVLRRFDGAVVSGEVGLLKPHPAIFALLVERYGLDPAESLVVDDSLANVDGARAAGFEAHHFVSPASLTAALVGYGLLPPPAATHRP